MSSKLRKSSNDSPNDEKIQKKGQKSHRRHTRHEPKSEDMTLADDMEDNVTPLKLTIKIGGQTLGEKSVMKSSISGLKTVSNQEVEEDSNEEEFNLSMHSDEEDDNFGSGEEIDEVEEPDEEEEWLDALEEGRLDEVDDELKKIRDPKLMTARQRALLENKSLKEKMESIKMTVSQESDKTMSKEMMERKVLKDRRRRQQAEEKREKDKKQTIERLLRKRQELDQKAKKKKRLETPRITYKSCQNGLYICLPNGMSFQELWAPKTSPPPNHSTNSGLKCSRNGCENDKKYLCSESKQFVCSLQCYKAVNKSN